MKEKVFLLVLLNLFLFIFHCGCLENDGEHSLIMTMGEFLNDYESNVDNNTHKITAWYTSLDAGDTVIIRDTIKFIRYNESTNITFIEFVSINSAESPISGNITDTFKAGDTIELKLHVIRTSFMAIIPPDEIWAYDLEVIKEGWDSESNTTIPIPEDFIRLALSV